MMDELDDDIPEIFDGKLQMINGPLAKSADNNEETNPNTDFNVDQPQSANENAKDCMQRSFFSSISEKLSPLVKRITIADNEQTVALPVQTPTNFFTFREGIIEKALADCLSTIIDDADGEFIGNYLLTEINLWDSDKERLVLLYSNCVLTVKYDFIALKILDYRRIALNSLDNIVVGDLVYPPGSLVPDRNATGVRLMWNNGEPLKFAVKWNPFTSDVPICTLTSHPLFYHSQCDNVQRTRFNFQEFVDKLRLMIGRESLCKININYKSIVLQNYVGLSSLIHNRNDFGFFKVRGKFSF